MTGIYIHIPFCKRKCPYCDFYSVAVSAETVESYVKALCRNIHAFKGQGIEADTVYFGGGTPSVMTAEQVESIMSALDESVQLCDTEVTLEANPCTVDRKKLADYKSAGITRLSFGVQSAQDGELEFLGRLHDFELALEAVQNAHDVGFKRLSCDIMLGLKGQTAKSLADSIDKLTALPIDHISAYMLKIEEGTPFDCDEVRKSVADEDTLCDMYLQTVKQLDDKGFAQYEISNFAKEGGQSRHNLKYWQGEEYIGLGASAHSYYKGERYFCPADIKGYIAAPLQEKVLLEDHPDKAEEYVMLGLRLTKGISVKRAAELGGEMLGKNISKKAALFAKQGLCQFDGDIVRLTPAGFLASNAIIGEMLW